MGDGAELTVFAMLLVRWHEFANSVKRFDLMTDFI